jgi:hypothetical protein
MGLPNQINSVHSSAIRWRQSVGYLGLILLKSGFANVSALNALRRQCGL